ncbi:Ger(x)C family spore germination protein [Paenibacillus daejeonensis]|uniref:Ger(x)C family spore germination protein n=1 Tax=Paenibacillus daejeonensis TaxID=135193 RepID=UPI00037265F9|nr:Ger(x)C family spore germination protein [Paenibacillus daejeonensis]
MIKHWLRFMYPFILLLLLCGCWNRVEMNEIGVISATAVDWKDGKWIVSYQLVIPQAISSHSGSSSRSEAPVNVFSTEGASIRQAIGEASREMSRKLYFAHNQIVVVSESAARKGISAILEIYMRNPDAREMVSMFITKGSSRKLIEQLLPIEKIPGNAIQRLIENEAGNNSLYPDMTLYRVLLDLLGPEQATGIPELTIAGADEPLNSLESLKTTSTKSKIRLGNLAVIQGDQLKSWLSQEDAAGLMWLTDEVGRVTIGFDCSKEQNGPKNSAAIVSKATTKHKPELSADGRVTMRVTVKANGSLLEYACPHKLTEPEIVKQIERRIAEEIEAEMMKSWHAVQRIETDIVGFGTVVNRAYPKQWKAMRTEWNQNLTDLKLEVKVTFNLTRVGFSTRNFKDAQNSE